MTAARLALRTTGEVALTAGVLVLLFVGWLLGWADRAAAADARSDVAGLERRWAAPAAPDAVVGAARPAAGKPFAVLHVPRFGRGWKVPVLQGTGAAVLRRGVGHYPSTALPGARGNVGIAGHRTTYGHPFRDVADLRTGDVVVVETAGGWFSYRVTGHRVVQPGRRDLLRSDPGRAELTLTTCHPEYSARQRWIVEAELAGSAGGRPARRPGSEAAVYGWLWRHLPGPWPVRALLALALAGVVVAVCCGWVFPAVADHLLAPTQTVGG